MTTLVCQFVSAKNAAQEEKVLFDVTICLKLLNRKKASMSLILFPGITLNFDIKLVPKVSRALLISSVKSQQSLGESKFWSARR